MASSLSGIANLLSNLRIAGKTAEQLFCAGMIAIQLQQIALEHGRPLAWVVHFLELSLEIAGVFLNSPNMDRFVGIENIQ
jgi:hypothetical protein